METHLVKLIHDEKGNLITIKVGDTVFSKDGITKEDVIIKFKFKDEKRNFDVVGPVLDKMHEREKENQDSKLTADVIQQGLLRSGYARYKCLCCEHTDRLEVTKEEQLDVKICPKCKGAFVDLFVYGRYKRGSFN
ncbi:hypothetical protein [Bacillus mycoides]|uniref:hypothetical protein n=1 Tax=Bacillus mycoides TaxID=1405 RepID=UPI003CFCF7BD